MAIIALVCAVVAAVIFGATAAGTPRRWASIAHGLVWLTVAVTIWHVVGGLKPVVN
jgi:hypothetical protein